MKNESGLNYNAGLDVFVKPGSVAVIGATERPGAWGSMILNGLITNKFPGKLYPVNLKAERLFGLPAYKDIEQIEGPVDLAIFTIPDQGVEAAVEACGRKGVKGITIITAGYGEATEDGKEREKTLVKLAHDYGMRLIGPNVSGTFDLKAKFAAAVPTSKEITPTSLAGVCQGGFAFYDLLGSASFKGMGVGKFIHTGNECDLTVTDFLEYFGQDPEVSAIVMYLETIRDARRFMKVARKVTNIKPVVVHKAGGTPGGARAASSHTGALAGRKALFEGALHQAGAVISPTMELLIPLAHTLIERPPMRGKRVVVVTMGGSWGVALSDSLEEAGLVLPELSQNLQNTLRSLDIPLRASLKNPIDLGASGIMLSSEFIQAVGRPVLNSGEVDVLILHGIGSAGWIEEDSSPMEKGRVEMDKSVILGMAALEKEANLPVFFGSHHSIWESQAVSELNQQGVRVYNRLDEIAQLLCLMYDYWRKGQGRG